MGTFANDRPPVLSLVWRQTGEHRYFFCDSASKELCHQIIHESVPAEGTILYTDGFSSYRDAVTQHAWVNHSLKAWARDDNGDGVREVRSKQYV